MTDVLTPWPRAQFFANNGTPAAGHRLFTYAAGTSTKLATHTSSTGLVNNTNPIVLDYRGEAAIWVPPNVAYKYVLAPPGVDDPPTAPIWSVDNLTSSQLVTLYGGVDTGSANVYTLTFVANFTAYTDGIIIYWIPANTNTGPSTVNVNGLGAVPIINQDGSVLRPSQIIANNVIGILYKGGNFILLNVNAVGLTPTVNTKNANYTFLIGDAYNIVLHTDANSWTYTVPADAATNFAIGTSIQVINQSGFPLFVSPAGGVTLYGFGGGALVSGTITLQASTACFITKTAANTWQQSTSTDLGNGTTFTGTLIGCTAFVTGNVGVSKYNGLIYITVNANLVGISNATNFSINGLPAAFRPGTTRVVPSVNMRDNGVDGVGGVASIDSATGVITFGKGFDNNTTGWTNANGKGVLSGWTLVFPQ